MHRVSNVTICLWFRSLCNYNWPRTGAQFKCDSRNSALCMTYNHYNYLAGDIMYMLYVFSWYVPQRNFKKLKWLLKVTQIVRNSTVWQITHDFLLVCHMSSISCTISDKQPNINTKIVNISYYMCTLWHTEGVSVGILPQCLPWQWCHLQIVKKFDMFIDRQQMRESYKITKKYTKFS